MESSAYYKQKVDEFTNLKAQLSGLLGPVETCVGSITKSRSYLDNIVICGEPVDKGVLGGNVGTTVNDIGDLIETLISECQTKINEYTDLYDAALKAEQEAAEREARRANRWWANWI